MDSTHIFVSVVGFSDVERHALNTVFRLSEERDLVYTLWSGVSVAGEAAVPAMAPVLLVDGSCAEAVLYHAKPVPAGQRLIWVGDDPPEHAWRVLRRPLIWRELVHDLDTVFAAQQADSGLIDLDVTTPAELSPGESAGDPVRRALLAGLGAGDRLLVVRLLQDAGIGEIDEVETTEAAVDALGRHSYCCAVFNLDEHQIDAWSLLQFFVQRNPSALGMAMSEHAGPLAGWWRRRRIRGHARRAGVSALVARPATVSELSGWFALL